ncbi:hypothetical protein L9F63_013347, partial [Diploptera punctata]
ALCFPDSTGFRCLVCSHLSNCYFCFLDNFNSSRIPGSAPNDTSCPDHQSCDSYTIYQLPQ